MSIAIVSPFIPYLDLLGNALQGGSIYFGQTGFVAQTQPITVYWDRGLSQPAAQPLPTINGNISRNGTPGNVFIASGDYSITVMDSSGRQVFATVSAFESGFIDEVGTPVTIAVPVINLLQNTNFENNSLGLISPVTLTVGQTGHDLYVAGSGGVTYSFSTTDNVTTINITAGTLTQTVAYRILQTGSYVLTWEGTAQARLNGGAYTNSPAVVNVVGGQDIICEWSIGTVKKVMLSQGTSVPAQWLVGVNYYLASPEINNNIIINGRGAIQNHPSSSTTTAGTYFVDSWLLDYNSPQVITGALDATSPTPLQLGYYNATSMAQSCAIGIGAVPAAANVSILKNNIEGNRFKSLAQRPLRINFWALATVSGAYSVSFSNGAQTYSCVLEYLLSANIWTYISMPVPATPSAGVWDYSNGKGLSIYFIAMSGTTSKTATIGKWQNSFSIASSNQVNCFANANGKLSITGVQLGLSNNYNTEILDPDFIEDDANCRRYYNFHTIGISGYQVATQSMNSVYPYQYAMRATPTLTTSGATLVNTPSITTTAFSNAYSIGITATATGTLSCLANIAIDAQLL